MLLSFLRQIAPVASQSHSVPHTTSLAKNLESIKSVKSKFQISCRAAARAGRIRQRPAAWSAAVPPPAVQRENAVVAPLFTQVHAHCQPRPIGTGTPSCGPSLFPCFPVAFQAFAQLRYQFCHHFFGILLNPEVVSLINIPDCTYAGIDHHEALEGKSTLSSHLV